MLQAKALVRPRALGMLGACWGVLGLFATLVEAIVRLTPLALEPLESGMSPGALTCYVGFSAVNAYTEGYRGFQRAFSPRVAVRVTLLAREPTLLRVVLAPLFLMALVDATRRRLFAGWMLVGGIVALVLVVRGLPQPWRGVIDAGVVVGLVWGTIATAWFVLRAILGHELRVDPETGR